MKVENPVPGEGEPHLERARALLLRGSPMEALFSAFYRWNLWFGSESRSGPGSSRQITSSLRRELPSLVRRLGVRQVLDIPCGDFHWMKEVDLGPASYVGADIVTELAERNNRLHADAGRTFLRLDITSDPLPRSDLILCRDCLVHFPHRWVWRALANVRRSASTYLLTTTFPTITSNANILFRGLWRPLNLEAPPFCFPPPLSLIDEQNTWKAQRYPGKSLGLWRVGDIPTGR